MKLILHIGTPKTGTSHLQRSFHEHGDDLVKHGILYPQYTRFFEQAKFDRNVGLRFAAEPIEKEANGLMVRAGLATKKEREVYKKYFYKNLRDEIERSGNIGTVVMSDEALFAFSSIEMIEELSKIVNAVFSTVVLVAFIRKPSDYLVSVYSQAVKMGAKKTWEEFLNDKISRPKSDSIFEKNLLMWKKHCEHDLFVVRALDGDVLSQFQRVTKMDYMPQAAKSGANSALSSTGIQVLRRINEIVGSGTNRPGSIRRVFEAYATGSKWKPCVNDLKAIDSVFEPEVVRLCEIFDIPSQNRKAISDWFEGNYPIIENKLQDLDEETIDEFARITLGLTSYKNKID